MLVSITDYPNKSSLLCALSGQVEETFAVIGHLITWGKKKSYLYLNCRISYACLIFELSAFAFQGDADLCVA